MKLCNTSIYKRRQKAHDILLKCDIEIDELLKIMDKLITKK